MKYLLAGIITGIVLNIFIFFPATGRAVIPEFTSSLKDLDKIEASTGEVTAGHFSVRHGNILWRLTPRGKVDGKTVIDKDIFAFSGDGSYYITYQKVGKEIQFYNDKGSRFWKLKSREYPYLSRNGQLIFLLNGDHSRIRMLNHNGNIENAPSFTGRLCTVIAFSPVGDFGSGGFLDGSYFLVGPQRQILRRGMTPGGKPVKGLAVSSGGKFLLVHYGSTTEDQILVVDLATKKEAFISLKQVHVSSSTLLVDDTGRGTIIDGDRILHFDKDGDVLFALEVAPKRDGHAALVMGNNFIVAGYTDMLGTGRAIVFDNDGRILFSRICTGESFMDVAALEKKFLLRGSDNLYCYSLHRANEE